MNRFAAILLLGTALGLGMAVPAAAADAPAAIANAPVVFGEDHVEAALTQALVPYITRGRAVVELDNPSLELRAPAGAGSLTAERVYFNPVNGRFAAELVIGGTKPAVRLPVAGRAFGLVEVPVLSRRLSQGEAIAAVDLARVEMRADMLESDVAASEEELVGRAPRRSLAPNQPVRLRDVQSPRLVDKGALVTIVLSTPRMILTAQGRAQQDGGKGDVVRVLNSQSNRTIEATVVGFNQVAVAKPGVPAF
jgi:flagellar basal body P-ring formation protein FlgA